MCKQNWMSKLKVPTSSFLITLQNSSFRISKTRVPKLCLRTSSQNLKFQLRVLSSCYRTRVPGFQNSSSTTVTQNLISKLEVLSGSFHTTRVLHFSNSTFIPNKVFSVQKLDSQTRVFTGSFHQLEFLFLQTRVSKSFSSKQFQNSSLHFHNLKFYNQTPKPEVKT